MKKLIYISIALMEAALCSCESNTYEDISDQFIINGTVTYTGYVKGIVDDKCVFCHAPGGDASSRPLQTYDQVKDAVLNHDLLTRIQLQSGEEDLMPKTGRMSQNRINVILQWNEDGLLE
ncbi:cytochrome c [Flavobacterium beibuense]|nr:cytochrome c [Flavobacterium beibuense]